jgi:hypothetical protein
MSKPPARQGPLDPRTDQDSVIVHNPPNDPMEMSPDEADLSGIRMLDQAAKARSNKEKGQRGT